MAATLVTTIKRFTGTAAERAALSIVGVPVGSTYLETDTGLIYIIDSAGAWAEKTGLFKLSGSTVEVIDCVIADEGTVSTEADISKYKYFSFLMPAGWDAATLTIYGSAVAGGTKRVIKNDAGQTFPVMTVAVDTVYSIDSAALMLAGVHFIAFVASAAQTTAARTIKLMCKQ